MKQQIGSTGHQSVLQIAVWDIVEQRRRGCVLDPAGGGYNPPLARTGVAVVVVAAGVVLVVAVA